MANESERHEVTYLITRDVALARLKELARVKDPEFAHHGADMILLRLLNDDEITEAFIDITRWYA